MLKTMNFGNRFIDCVKMLYNDIQSCVINNGKSSQFFNLHCGIRQGCCLSALLFIIVVEYLSTDIRDNKMVKGITIGDHEHLINQLADDTTLFIDSEDCLTHAFDRIEHFGLCSGLTLNKSKTEIVPLNSEMVQTNKSFEWKYGPFKSLGVWFSASHEVMFQLNIKPKLNAIQHIINVWSGQGLSIKGKVTVIKSLIISQIVNIPQVCSAIYVPESFITDVDRILFSFLWGQNKRPKVKRKTVVNDYAQGGVKMVDFKQVITSIKASWVKRLLIKGTTTFRNKWRYLALKICGINDTETLLCKISPIRIQVPTWCTSFYRQVLACWFSFFSVEPKNYIEILEEKIQYNQYVKIQDKPLGKHSDFLKQCGIIHIRDIVDEKGLMSKTNIEVKYGCHIPNLTYNSIISALPIKWKDKIKTNKKPLSTINYDIKHIHKNVSRLQSRDIYEYMTFSSSMPSVVDKWVEYFFFIIFYFFFYFLRFIPPFRWVQGEQSRGKRLQPRNAHLYNSLHSTVCLSVLVMYAFVKIILFWNLNLNEKNFF